MDPDESVLKEFVEESLKNLGKVEESLLLFCQHRGPTDRKTISGLRREIHTIKGCAGFFPLEDIEKLASVTETILDLLSEKCPPLKAEMRETIREGFMGIRRLLQEISDKTGSREPDDERPDIEKLYTDLSALLAYLASSDTDGCSDPSCVTDEDNTIISGFEIRFEINPRTLRKLPAMHEYLYILEYDLADYSYREGKSPTQLVKELLSVGMIADAKIHSFSKDMNDDLQKGHFWYIVLYSTILGNDFIDAAVGLSSDRIFPVDREKLGDTDVILYNVGSKKISLTSSSSSAAASGSLLLSENDDSEERMDPQYRMDDEKQPVFIRDTLPVASCDNERRIFSEESRGRTLPPPGIRVDLDKLDNLINLVGELVTAESMVTKSPDLKGLKLEKFERSSHSMRRIISDLQNVAMSIRMISLAELFSSLVRTVRDLSAKQGKQIQVRLIGPETETDKTVIEQISESLAHIVRYAVTYGIERPEERQAAGKTEIAMIRLEARQEGGDILISVSDNGRGLSRKEILRQAIRRGLADEDGRDLSYEEICRFVFDPDFYSESVPDAYLPLVRQNVEKLKGRTELQSVPGQGTVILLRIPISLTIIDGMLIRIGSTVYTIPLLSIRESLCTSADQITVTMSGLEMIHVRNEILPVIRLHRIYGIIPDREKLEQGILITVVSGSKKICLFADEIIGHQQTVVKPMPEYIGNTYGISGCTILENGGVGFILDVGAIIEMTESKENHCGFSEKRINPAAGKR